ncbi:unnamed protein product [Prorocentrum cordatum]|uniref:Uncharacterized protein n=1 Tax=Prorocentrum cordatum TaxID=2364126 RepID=A0ABN9PD84_9DINO|nr:unnamed protein product [Polarella glacialis]
MVPPMGRPEAPRVPSESAQERELELTAEGFETGVDYASPVNFGISDIRRAFPDWAGAARGLRVGLEAGWPRGLRRRGLRDQAAIRAQPHAREPPDVGSISSPCAGWASELPAFLALAPGQAAPALCGAATHAELLRREAAAFNERGEDLRCLLDRDCQDVVALRSGLEVARLRSELEAVEREHAFLDKTAVLSATQEAASTRGWGSIPLRSIGGAMGDAGSTNTGVQTGGEYADTPLMEKFCPYIRQIVRESARVECSASASCVSGRGASSHRTGTTSRIPAWCGSTFRSRRAGRWSSRSAAGPTAWRRGHCTSRTSVRCTRGRIARSWIESTW